MDKNADIYTLSLFGTGIFFISSHDIAVYNSPHSLLRSVGRAAVYAITNIITGAITILTLVICDKYGGKKS